MRQIDFHYDAPLPTIAAGLSEYYARNGYQASSDTLSTNTLSTFTSAPLSITGQFQTTTITSQIRPTVLASLSTAVPSIHQIASSELNSSAKAGLGVGVGLGVSIVGLLLYFSVRWLRRRSRRDLKRTINLRNPTVKMPGSERFEKPELAGEDAAVRRGAEVIGDEAGIEMDATLAEQRVRHELST